MDKKNLFILIFFLGLLVLLGDQAGVYSVTGGTVMSIDEADFRSSSDFFDGDTWIVTMSQGGMAQSITGDVESDDLEERTGAKSERDFSVDITKSKQKCSYAINKEDGAKPVYDYYLNEWKCYTNPTEEEIVSRCGSDHLVSGQHTQFSSEDKCYCVGKTKMTGGIAERTIENPYVRTISTIEVSNGDNTVSEQFDTQGKIKGYVGENTYVTWDGYLGRDVCPTSDPYYGFYYNGQWRVGSATNYENYKDTVDQLQTCDSCWVDQESADDSISTLKSVSQNARETKDFGDIRNAWEQDSAVIEEEMDSPVEIPVWTFYINSDWLGVYQPIGEPKFTDARSPKFKASAEGNIIFDLKNVGDGRDTFDVYAECDEPFRMAENTKSYTLETGETVSGYLSIAADTDESVTADCDLYAQGVENSDRTTVEVSVDPQQVCEPGAKECANGDIQICNEEGSGYEVFEECGSGETCSYDSTGQAYCKDKDEPSETSLLDRILPDLGIDIGGAGFELPDISGLAFWGRLLLGSIGGLLGFLSLSKVTSKIKNQYAAWGIPASVGIGMFIMAWTGLWAFALILTIVWFAVEWVV